MPALVQFLEIAQEEKRKLYYVVTVAYARNFAEVMQAIFLFKKRKT